MYKIYVPEARKPQYAYKTWSGLMHRLERLASHSELLYCTVEIEGQRIQVNLGRSQVGWGWSAEGDGGIPYNGGRMNSRSHRYGGGHL